MTEDQAVEVLETKWDGLPEGFQVQIDTSAFIGADRARLIGGSPMKMMTLSPRAVKMIDPDGRLRVVDAASATVARRLLVAQLAHPRPMFGPREDELTVVIPVRDNQSGIDRMISALTGIAKVLIVDDGSQTPIVADGFDHVEVIRVQVSEGPAAARNRGAAAASTEFVAFLDSDVVPERDWLQKLLPHFSDDSVAMVAPRITALSAQGGPTVRYEARCSSLDMGRSEAAVLAGTPVPYVPSAALIVRRSVFSELGGFDESLHVAEDVDLCWRMGDAGAVIRYEPIARVAHDHRATLFTAMHRRRFYGTGAALLADRHHRLGAPLVLNWPLAILVGGLLSGTWQGGSIGVVMAYVISRKLRARIAEVPSSSRIALALTARSVGFGLLQVASALCRSYWPVSLLLALISRRFRAVLATVLVGEGVVEWIRSEGVNPEPLPPLGLPMFLAYKRIDDIAYGAGLWQGVLVNRRFEALIPTIGN